MAASSSKTIKSLQVGRTDDLFANHSSPSPNSRAPTSKVLIPGPLGLPRPPSPACTTVTGRAFISSPAEHGAHGHAQLVKRRPSSCSTRVLTSVRKMAGYTGSPTRVRESRKGKARRPSLPSKVSKLPSSVPTGRARSISHTMCTSAWFRRTPVTTGLPICGPATACARVF